MIDIRTVADGDREGVLWKCCNMKGLAGVNPGKFARFVIDVTRESVCDMTVVTTDEILPSFAKYYASERGAWTHSGGRTVAHNDLGMAWAYWAMNRRIGDEMDIELGDSPDITGSIGSYGVYGDVGQCTAVAMFEGFNRMRCRDLWLSVLDYQTQVIIEPYFDLCKTLALMRDRVLEAA